MDQFKHVFNAPSLYDVLFFDVITITEYDNVDTFKEKDVNGYLHWHRMAKKRYDSVDDNTYMETACFIPEYSKIVAISYGGFYVENGKMNNYFKTITGEESTILERFFKIMNDFKKKKQDGFLCGHNISGYHIPTLIKRGLKHKFKIPHSIKNNLMAKPWENAIIDTIDLWKFTGNEYVSLDAISHFLDIEVNYDDLSLLNNRIWYAEDYNLENASKTRFEHLIKLYSKLRNM